MDENKENVRDWLNQLGLIVETIEKTFIDNNCKVVIELEEEKFRKFQKNFRDIDRNRDEIIVVIDNVEFTFFLKKS
jgi:hypothetical protein